MKEKQDLLLLREYVRVIISEDDGGDAAADMMAGAVDASPYGMSGGGNGKSVFKAFAEPFTDVFKVGLGKTKELAVKTQTLAKVAFETIVTTLIPFFSDEYAKIFANEKKKIANIRQEYGEVYNRLWETFGHNDLKLLAFMYDPYAAGAMLTYFGGKAGVNAAIETVDALSGGWLKNAFDITSSPKKSHHHVASGHGGVQEESVERLSEAVTADSMREALSQPEAKKLQAAAAEVVQGTLKEVMGSAHRVLSVGSLADLVKASGSDKVRQALLKLQNIPQQERALVEKEILQTSKRSFKEFYLKNLQGQLKKALDSGVPKSSAFVRDYTQAINKIKAM
jgi:hypothetical protein